MRQCWNDLKFEWIYVQMELLLFFLVDFIQIKMVSMS